MQVYHFLCVQLPSCSSWSDVVGKLSKNKNKALRLKIQFGLLFVLLLCKIRFRKLYQQLHSKPPRHNHRLVTSRTHLNTWIHRYLCVWSKKVYNCGGTHKQLRQLLLFHTQRIKLIFSGLHSSWLIPFQRFSIKCTSPYFGNLVFIHTRWIRLQSWWQGSQFKSTYLMSATGQYSYKIQTVQFKSFQFSCEDKCINSLWNLYSCHLSACFDTVYHTISGWRTKDLLPPP